jgi:hypothetical protein
MTRNKIAPKIAIPLKATDRLCNAQNPETKACNGITELSLHLATKRQKVQYEKNEIYK